MEDHGPNPFVVDIEKATLENDDYRQTVWTGKHIQMTLMSIPVGGNIGLEVHEDTDQFLRVEQGNGRCKMGDSKDDLDFQEDVEDDSVILVPAGKWHDVENTGDKPLKIYTLYGPPHHAFGIVHKTKEDSEHDEEVGTDIPPRWTDQ